MAPEPANQEQTMVGIFWLVEGRLIIDASPISEAEPYGDCLTHHGSHLDFWTQQQQLWLVPRDSEYESFPRGRVVYSRKKQRFALYADRCILKKKSVVKQIMRAMHLSTIKTDVTTDGPNGHYRCPCCLAESVEHDDDDWD